MGDTDARLSATLDLGGQSDLHVHAVRGHEALSQAFRFEVDCTGPIMDLDGLRLAKASLTLSHPEAGARVISGVVEAIQVALTKEDAPRYRVVLIPSPGVLAYRRGFRIFQDQTVPDIVKKVLKDAGIPAEGIKDELNDSYSERPYCVQYDESDWAFVSRLLEEEGIHHAFVHSDDGHVLSLRDQSSSSPDADPSYLSFHPEGFPPDGAARIWAWRAIAQATVTHVTLNDYDGLRPSAPMVSEEKVEDAGSGKREWYEYPAGFAEASEGSWLAKRRLEAARVGRTTFRATTNALGIQTGTILELQDHPAADGKYLVVEARLTARVDREETKGPLVEQGPASHVWELTLIPKDVPFRPERRTPKPRIIGIQTARVSGAQGEEIHCDEHGRVKLQFHWDREGKLDDKTSCWVRVTQAHTTGSVMIPRVGWEALVEFIGGDPDRPLVQGRVYNPAFPPPVDLPAERTVSGHISRSSPGGGGMNAVKFDDAAGSERLDIIGHRNVSLKVANNQNIKVTKNDRRTIGKNHESQITAGETVTVGDAASLKVGATHKIKVGANRTVKVTGGVSESIKGDNTVQVGGAEMLQVGNPAAAVLEVITSAAIAAAQGAAAAAVGRAQAALLAPLQPVLGAARAALAGTTLPGAVGALLSGDPALAISALASPNDLPAGAGGLGGRAMPGDLGEGGLPDSAMAPLADGSSMAAGAAGAAESGALGAAGESAEGDGASDAAGGGDSAGGGAAGGDGAAGGGDGAGNGLWGVTVQGSVKEKIGALAAITSLKPIVFGIGGASTEMIGAARIEVIRGSKSEQSGAAKIETVGAAYILNAKEGITIDAQAAVAHTIAGARKVKIDQTHAISAEGASVMTVARLKVEASESITLKCGQAEVTIDSSGVTVKGTDVTVKGTSELRLDPPAIGPG